MNIYATHFFISCIAFLKIFYDTALYTLNSPNVEIETFVRISYSSLKCLLVCFCQNE